MKIRAAVARAPHQPFIIEEVELDRPRPGEVLVKLVATGICHSDMSVIEQIVPLPLPYVLGHEGAGIVEQVGEGVTELAAGDHVVLTFGSCGHCPTCQSDHPAYCDSFLQYNNYGRRADGSATVHDLAGTALNAAYFSQSSFATHAIALERNAVKVRRDAPLKQLGPFGCGLITGAGTVFNVLQPKPNKTFAIFGIGTLGFAALFAAKLMGCTRIVVVDRVKSRLDLARDLGATDIIDTTNGNLAEQLSAIGGIDYAFDTTGVPRVIEAAVQALSVRGVCALVGASKEPDFVLSVMGMIPGRVVQGVIEGDCDPKLLIPKLVDHFMAGDFPVDRISKFYEFGDINAAAADGVSGRTIKPILVF